MYHAPPKPTFLEDFMVNSRVLGGQNLYSSWLWGLMVYIVLFRVSFMILMLRLVHVREQEYRSRLRCDLGRKFSSGREMI